MGFLNKHGFCPGLKKTTLKTTFNPGAHSVASCYVYLYLHVAAMLTWLYGPENATRVLAGASVPLPTVVPQQFRDSSVQSSLPLLQNFLDVAELRAAIDAMGDDDWVCSLCSIGFSSGRSVGCDSCLLWYHFACVNIKRAPAKKEWFCRACTRKR